MANLKITTIIVTLIISAAAISNAANNNLLSYWIKPLRTAISYAVNNNSVESIANSIETRNPLILPTIKDKISYVLNGETNGLHNVSLKEIISLNDDTVAQTRFLQCSVTYKNHFVFSEACHSMRYKNYMTKYNLEPLQKIRQELVFNDILAQAGKDLVRVGIEAKQPISRIN